MARSFWETACQPNPGRFRPHSLDVPNGHPNPEASVTGFDAAHSSDLKRKLVVKQREFPEVSARFLRS
jgi:hypothetical protein